MSKETVEIEDCPHCGGTHTYSLEVKRAHIIKLLTPEDMYERPRNVEFTRIFVCPVKDEQYQATFYLQDTSSDRIENVSVSR